MNNRPLSQKVLISFLLAAGVASVNGVPYRVFDWQGKAAPGEPTESPPGAGAVTHTSYLNGGQYWNGSALTPMDVDMDITVTIWDAPTKWKVDPEGFISGGNPANYGYQSPNDEAEFNFGDPNGQVVMRFDILFGQPVNNPSFLLMDIDNNGSDHGTGFQATTSGGGTVYPTMSLVTGSTVAWTGSGSTLDVFSNGGASTDNVAAGAAFFEWQESNVTGISFTWESNDGTSIRVSNIYAEYDPPGFIQVVPEPSGALLVLLCCGGILLRRRR
jgi:hypothetical protein